MQARTLQTWSARCISSRQRLERVCTSDLCFLMVVTTKHSFEEAARFSGLPKSQFSKVLKSQSNVAISTLEHLSKKQAKHFSKPLQDLKGLPWKIALLMESTLQHRASLHPENAKKFNHGQGFVIGHQGTNIVLIINDMLIPLRPIPYDSKRYGLAHHLDYQTEHALVVDYISNLHLEDYIASYDPGAVIGVADSGYDDKKSENAIANKHWHFIMTLGKTRRVKSETLYLTPPKSRQWGHMATFFRHHRRLKWPTIRCMTNGAQRQRMALRIRHTMGYLRSVGRCNGGVQNPKNDRMVAARIEPVMSSKPRHARSCSGIVCAGRSSFFIKMSSNPWALRMLPRVDLTP